MKYKYIIFIRHYIHQSIYILINQLIGVRILSILKIYYHLIVCMNYKNIRC